MKSIPVRPASAYELLPQIGNKLQSLLLLFVRVYWGWQFIQTGSGKLSHLPKVTHYFATLGMPSPHVAAVFVSWLELIGGILLILGLASRLISVALFIDMIVAYVTADRGALLSFTSDPGKFYTADEYTFLFAAAMVFVFGPGLFAIDTLIRWMTHPKKERKAQPV
ncbi:MAG: DoxX family protein [Candidatus Acidiferrales bacterium]